MTDDEREALISGLLDESTRTRTAKGRDYSGAVTKNADVNANFKRVAADLGLSPAQVAWVYFSKHKDSVATFLKTGAVASEPIRGRLVDMLNYVLILASLLEEEGTLNEGSTATATMTTAEMVDNLLPKQFARPARVSPDRVLPTGG